MTEARPWPEAGRPRRAGVSSFGISGTNAHVILEQAAREDRAPSGHTPGGVVPWVLSARSREELNLRAGQLLAHVQDHAELDPVDVGHSLARGRSGLPYRVAVTGTDRDSLLRLMSEVAQGHDVAGVQHARVTDSAGGLVFAFPGQGAQWPGMGAALLELPAFAESMDECASALAEFVDWSLLDVLGDEAALARVEVLQPALWAVMVSLAALWRSWGIEPVAVLGHSQGEIAAACVAGGLSLRDGACVVALRSRAIAALAGTGGMLSIRSRQQTWRTGSPPNCPSPP